MLDGARRLTGRPSAISSTSSTPRGGHRFVDPLSPVQSDEEAGPGDAATTDRPSQLALAKMQRERTRAIAEQASFMANRTRSLEQKREQRVDHEQPSDNSGGEQEDQHSKQDPEHDPYRISDDEIDRPASDRTQAGRHHSPLEREEQDEAQEEQDEAQEEQDREREEAEEIWPYSQSSEDELVANAENPDSGESEHEGDMDIAVSDDSDNEIWSAGRVQPSWFVKFPASFDAQLCGFYVQTATRNAPHRRFCRNTYNGKLQRLPERDPYVARSESECADQTIAGPAGDWEALRDLAASGHPQQQLVVQYMASASRPTEVRAASILRIMQESHHMQARQNRNQGVNKLYPRQVRELYMAMESRVARKAIKAKYRLTREQWEWLCQEWRAYIESQGTDDNRLSVRRLKILDKFTNSRMARALLRDLGPKPEAWWRKIKREWNAYRGDHFGSKDMNPTLTFRGTRAAQRRASEADDRAQVENRAAVPAAIAAPFSYMD
jgi:hypothetical protein